MNTKQAERAKQRRIFRQRLAERMSKKTPNEIAEEIRRGSDGFLFTPEWRELRERAAAKYGCVCARCGRGQTKDRPINFDHIKPRKFFPELALSIDNLQPLCGSCNKRKGNKHSTDYRNLPTARPNAGDRVPRVYRYSNPVGLASADPDEGDEDLLDQDTLAQLEDGAREHMAAIAAGL